MEASQRNRIILYLFIASLFLSGCATVETKEEWQRIDLFSVEKTGMNILWHKNGDDERLIKDEIKKLLSDGLSMEDSIRIALLNNKKLQAAFEEIGIAKADLVQAGLLANPDLSLLFRFPFGGGKTGIEAGGLLNISDLWQIPVKKKVAASRLEVVINQIFERILDVVKEVKTAYIDYASLSLIRDEIERMKDTIEEWKDHLIYRERFGFTRAIDIYFAEAILTNMEIDFSKTESELIMARYRLNRIMGLRDNQWEIDQNLKFLEVVPSLPSLDSLISDALKKRPDLQMKRAQVEEARRILSLERSRIFNNVRAGIAYEKGVDGEETIGPELGIQIPLFDQNQARIVRAEFRLRQAEKDLEARIDEVREDISTSFERLSFLRQQINLLKEKIIPAREAAVAYAEKYFNAMELNMLFVLEAKKNLIEAKKSYLNALKDYHKEFAGLERITGGFKYEGH